MDESAQEESALHFGVFDLDLETGELRKSGVLLHLPPQPFKILSLLASHPSQLVTREEIQQQIWGSETFVDFEQGLNFAIKKIRDALGDDAETPRYIETLPRRGYRFIAAVETARRAVSNGETLPRNVSAAPETAGAQEGSPPPTASTPQQITTGGYTRRAVTALAQGVEEEHRARLRWRRMAALGLGLAGVVVGLAGLMSLNVGGLRERVLTLV
ncbi:MAG: winged helix-turn-helix domain-containing protein, partial [Acidobacteriia bacterium]|nr:winged helix-turn-helix domain-containing protein [Terriglobia bacterium]